MAVIAAAAVASLAACGGSSGSSSSGARADKVRIGPSSDNAPTGRDPRHTFAAIIAEPRPVERPRMPDFSLPE